MNKLINSNNLIHISWLFLLYNPLLSILCNIYTFARFKKISFYTLSFSIVLIYMYFPMPWDAIHNFEKVFIYQDGYNFYQYIIYYLTNLTKLSYISTIFLFSLSSALVLSRIFSVYYKDQITKRSRSYLLILILLFLIIFEFRNFLDLNKTFI